MFQFLQPLFLALIGIAMFIYGLVHAVTGFPPSLVFSEVIRAMPSLMTILLFALGVTAVFVGIYLVVAGIRGVKRRLREIRTAYGHRQSQRYVDDEEEDFYGEPAYR